MEFKEKNLGYIIAILSIFLAYIMISEWKKYEAKAITASKKPIMDSLKYDATVSAETAEKINLLEKMAMAEREKIKVMIEHDNSPLTKADKASNSIISKVLKKTNIEIISEEKKITKYDERKKWEYYW